MGILNSCHASREQAAIRTQGPAWAGFVLVLALALAGIGTPARAADSLGRLFLTPQQRQDLDRRRATNRAEEEAPQIKEGPLTLEGHVARSSGKSATWINGTPQYDSHASGDPALVTIVPNAGEQGVRLKVGQTYERSSGEIRGILNGGEIEVNKSPRRAGATHKPPAATPSR